MNFSFKPKPTASLVIRSNAVELAWEQTGKIPGTVRVPVDVPGDAGLAQAIRQALEATQLKITRLAVSIPSSDVLVRYFSMPTLPKAELESAIAFEARKYVPFKMDSLVWDCFHVMPSSSGNGRQGAQTATPSTEVVFAGLPKESFTRFQSILAAVGIRVVVVEPLSQTLARLVASGKLHPSDTFDCILELAQDRAQLIIAKAGVPYLTRDIQWPVLKEETASALDAEAQRLLSELRVSMDFFKREHLSATFTTVTCFGEQEVVLRCVRALNGQLPCPVVSGSDQVSGVVLDREIPLVFAPAVGLLKAANGKANLIPLNFLRRAHMGDAAADASAHSVFTPSVVNLNPADFLALAKHPQVGLTALLVSAGVSALFWMVGGAEVSKLEHQLNQLQAEGAVAGGGMEHMDQAALKPIQQQAKEQLKFLKEAIDHPVIVSEKLDAIVRALPEGVWLTGLTYESRLDLTGRTKGPVANTHLSLSGACFLGGSDRELSAIQELETRLKGNARLLESFGSIRLGKIDATPAVQQEDTTYRVFQLNAQQSSGRL